MTIAMRGRRTLKPILLALCVPAAALSGASLALARGATGAAPHAGHHATPSVRPAGAPAPQRIAPTGIWRQEPIAAGTFRPSPQLPATFRPSATWPQQHFHFRRHRTGVAVVSAGPQVILAPAEAPLELTHAEPPLDAYVEPCAAPLIIRISGDTGPANAHGVRVIHASPSGCATPQVVNARGAKIVQVGPEVGPEVVKPAREPVRARY